MNFVSKFLTNQVRRKPCPQWKKDSIVKLRFSDSVKKAQEEHLYIEKPASGVTYLEANFFPSKIHAGLTLFHDGREFFKLKNHQYPCADKC